MGRPNPNTLSERRFRAAFRDRYTAPAVSVDVDEGDRAIGVYATVEAPESDAGLILAARYARPADLAGRDRAQVVRGLVANAKAEALAEHFMRALDAARED